MKKIIKVFLTALAAVALSLNIALSFNGNNIKEIEISTEVQTANAEGCCWLSLQFMNCFCKYHLDYYCAGFCPDGCTEMLCGYE